MGSTATLFKWIDNTGEELIITDWAKYYLEGLPKRDNQACKRTGFGLKPFFCQNKDIFRYHNISIFLLHRFMRSADQLCYPCHEECLYSMLTICMINCTPK